MKIVPSERLLMELLQNEDNWNDFLRTSGNNFGLPLADILSVYQKFPYSRVILTGSMWNQRFNRVVLGDAEGIPVLSASGKQESYYDLSQTRQVEGTEFRVPVWELKTGGDADQILAALKEHGIAQEDNLTDYLSNSVRQSFSEQEENFIETLSRVDGERIPAMRLFDFLRESAVFAAHFRVFRAANLEQHSHFVRARVAETAQVFTGHEDVLLRAVGQVLQPALKGALAPVARVSRTLGMVLSEEEIRAYVAEHEARPSNGQRETGETVFVPGEAQEPTPEEESVEEPGKEVLADEENVEEDFPEEIDELSDLDEDVVPMPLTEEEQEEEALSSVILPEGENEQLEQVLVAGGGTYRGSKYRLYEAVRGNMARTDLVDLLKKEYGIGGHSIPDGWANYNGSGFYIEVDGPEGKHQTRYSWTTVAKEIELLVSSNRYLSARELERYPEYLEETERTTQRAAFLTGELELLSVPNDQKRLNLPYRLVTFLANLPESDTEIPWYFDEYPQFREFSIQDAEKLFTDPEELESMQEFLNFTAGRTSDTVIRRIADGMAYEISDMLAENEYKQIASWEYHVGDQANLNGDTWEIWDIADGTVMLRLADMPLVSRSVLVPDFEAELTENTEENTNLIGSTRWVAATTEAEAPAAEIIRPYQVVTYHHSENGFDEKRDYMTVEEADKVAQGYVDGTLENDGFQYEGAAVYDLQERRYIRIYGLFPHEAVEPAVSAPEQEQTITVETEEPVPPVGQSEPEVNAGEDAEEEEAGDPAFPASLVDFYNTVKEQNPDNLVLLRIGDFYELYGEDAETAGQLLSLTIGTRTMPGVGRVSMCGFPYIRLQAFTRQLAEAGYGVTYLIPDLEGGHHLIDTVALPAERQTEEAQPEQETPEPVTQPEPDPIVPFVPTVAQPDPIDFHIADEALGAGTKGEKYAANVAAITLIKQLEQENRMATAEEQEVLSRYVGWGGLPEYFSEDNAHYQELKDLLTEEEYKAARSSTNTAFFTPPVVIDAIYQVLDRLGFRRGNILEPACGVGNFFGRLPESMRESKLFGVELDPITAKIAKQLYQTANIQNSGYEATKLRDNYFDVAIGNVPFGDFGVFDRAYNSHHFLIHDFFFAKTLDKVRPGGIIAFITSSGTMDKESIKVREYIAGRAELIGAIRLPNNTFLENAGTGVTSDIIFLRKREVRDMNLASQSGWHDRLVDFASNLVINEYFVRHPNMMLGRMGTVKGLGGRDVAALLPHEHGDLRGLLAAAVDDLTGNGVAAKFRITQRTVEDGEITDAPQDADVLRADEGMKNNTHVVMDGKIYLNQDGVLIPFKGSSKAIEKMTEIIALRDLTDSVLSLQLSDRSTDVELAQARGELNQRYDAFVARYGYLSAPDNRRLITKDAGQYRLSALENVDEDGNVTKADIFTKRTQFPRVEITHADTAEDALYLSLSEHGRVDMAYMGSLTDKTEDELFGELRGKVFLNPEWTEGSTFEKYIYADEYLSGPVVEKLHTAMAFVGSNPALQSNIEALQIVQPKPLGPADITVHLGAPWLPPAVVLDFVKQHFQPPRWWVDNDYRTAPPIQYEPKTATWTVKPGGYYSNPAITVTYGTEDISAFELLERILNRQEIAVYDSVYEDGKSKRVRNTEKSQAASAKADFIKQTFDDWVWQDAERAAELCDIYNSQFNCTVAREYDGSFLRFPEKNPNITLREHQRNAIARVLFGKNTLLGHAVGAGKTYEICAAAQESKRLGLCTKSLIVVPNSILGDWATSYLTLYPTANILVATERDFKKENRRAFFSRIQTGDWDAVIMGHSQFDRLPVSRERQLAYLNDEMYRIEEAIEKANESESGGRASVKVLEAAKKRARAKLDKLYDQERLDNEITFEELGFDRLFVDEAHNYKNLAAYSKMSDVSGLSQTEAQKSSNMYLKIRYINEINGGGGVIFATGTPISNTMVEMFTLQRYLQLDTLEKYGIDNFDAWAGTFGEVVESFDVTPDGNGFRSKRRFGKFDNLPELMSIFREVADIKTQEVLDLKVPKAVRHNIIIPPSDEQLEAIQDFGTRADRIHAGAVEPSEDNMLKVTNDGRKLALDQRLYDPTLGESEDSKLKTCADNVFCIWKDTGDFRGTQLVFCDLSTPKQNSSSITTAEEPDEFDNVYADLKRKLIGKGIPPEEIAFVHDATNSAQKDDLDKKVRSGKIRVLIGSTGKLGTGTNVQTRLAAMHHLDCPYRPSDLEQREGRGIRQGNLNESVDIFVYLGDKTFDSYLYQMVEHKQRFIGQIWTNKTPQRSMEDIDERALSYGEIKALVSGNPMIREKMELDVEVERLRVERNMFFEARNSLQTDITKNWPRAIASRKVLIEKQKADMGVYKEHEADNITDTFRITLRGKDFTVIKDAEESLRHVLHSTPYATTFLSPIGEFCGMELSCARGVLSPNEMTLALRGQATYKIMLDAEKLSGVVGKLRNLAAGISREIMESEQLIGKYEENIRVGQVEVQREWPNENLYQAKKQRLDELEKLLCSDQQPTVVTPEETIGGVQGYAAYHAAMADMADEPDTEKEVGGVMNYAYSHREQADSAAEEIER